MSKRTNPFRKESIYHAGFSFWQEKQVVTRSQLANTIEETGLTNRANPEEKHRAAILSATILLSPRKTSNRGDCRGNVSTYGHLYYADPLKKIKGEEKKFKLTWRKSPLDRINYRRPSQVPKTEIPQVKEDVVLPEKSIIQQD
jgi:hypothetical protein